MEGWQAKSFRLLKPLCVEVSQVALKYKAKKSTSKDLIEALQQLLSLLSSHQVILDQKLADYVFFPLSHIFREAKEIPVRAVEIALSCLQVLILQGWHDQMSLDMSKQLLIMLCFLAGGEKDKSRVKDVQEELGVAAFDCLASQAHVTKNLGIGEDGCIREGNLPILGHAISTSIDGITEGPSAKVQLTAMKCLSNILESVQDVDALKATFPGIVSSLTKILSPKWRHKAQIKTMAAALETLWKAIIKILGDDQVGLANGEDDTSKAIKKDGWLEATSHQVHMALANIMPLRYHERLEIQTSLFQLCESLLLSCRKSLSQTTSLFLETMVVLLARADKMNQSLPTFILKDSELTEMLKLILRDWILTMPRVLQSPDEGQKQRLVDQIGIAYSLLQDTGSNMELVSGSLATNLTASISTAVQRRLKERILSTPESENNMALILGGSQGRAKSLSFPPVLLSDTGDRITLGSLERLITNVHSRSESVNFEQNLMTALRTSTGTEQVASLWLCLQVISKDVSDLNVLDQFIEPSALQLSSSSLLDELYTLSLSILSQSTFDSDDSTWRLQALSLEALTLQAQVQKKDFRPEFVDALYPILERLGSNNAALQLHAMTCLDIVSQACEYSNPAALIIDNADYLVNAIALKLNTFSISPQAPQVLVMMIRLCGAPLIPFLDDLVESMFSILACYHGYPKLVESFFTVLNAIVNESSKGIIPLIESGKDSTTRPTPYKPTTIPELADLLRSMHEKAQRPLSPPPTAESPPPSTPPSRPTTPPLRTDDDPSNLDTLPTADPPAPKPSKANTIVTSITSLTPSHLTSPSPTLRTSLLHLLSTSFPQLAQDTDHFLPIAAQLYPYISTRLFASGAPPFEIVAAAEAMRVLCRCAGDFLRSRMDGEWVRLMKLFERLEKEMREEVRAQRGRVGGTWWRAWDAVVILVVGLIRDVGVDEEVVGRWVFETLGVYIGGEVDPERWSSVNQTRKQGGSQEMMKRGFRDEDVMSEARKEEVQTALEELNPDALWLVQERGRVQRGGQPMKTPADVDDVAFDEIAY